MPPRVRCKCGQVLLAPQDRAGSQAKCPRCAQVLTVPWLLGCSCGRRIMTPRLPQRAVSCPDCGGPMAHQKQDTPPTDVPPRPPAPEQPPAQPAPAVAEQTPPPPASPATAPETAKRGLRLGRIGVAAALCVLVVGGAFGVRLLKQRTKASPTPAPTTQQDRSPQEPSAATSQEETATGPASLPPPTSYTPAPPPKTPTMPQTASSPPAASARPQPAHAAREPLPKAPAGLSLLERKPRERPQPAHVSTTPPADTDRPERPTVEPPPKGPASPRVAALAPEIAIDRWWRGRGRDTIQAYRDDYLVLHFLAPTCDACAKTVQALNDLYDRFHKLNVHVIGIARVVGKEPEWKIHGNRGGGRAVRTGDTGHAMGAFIRATRPRYPIAVDRGSVSMKNYHVRPRSTQWHVSSSGAVIWRDHTVRGDKGETCFLIGRNGAVLWAGDGGDDTLQHVLKARLKSDIEKKRRYETWLQGRVGKKTGAKAPRP